VIKVLLVPSSDFIGHPFPQRHNQIFERLNTFEDFEVHVVRYHLFDKNIIDTKLVVHELEGQNTGFLAGYYLFNALNHAAQIRKIIRNNNIDVVVLSNLASPYAFTLIDELSKIGVRIIVDLPDYFPTSATGNIFDVGSIRGKFFNTTFDLMLRRIMKHADLITVVSQALKSYALQSGARQVEIVPNGIAEHFLKCTDDHQVREKLGFQPEDYVIGYIGSMEFWLEMAPLFRGVSIAIKNGVPAKLLLVGKSLHTNYTSKVEDQLKSEGIEKSTTWVDFISYENVPYYMNAIDVGTVPFDVCNHTAYYSSPNKIWEYLSQQVPVLSTPIPEAVANSNYLTLVEESADYGLMFSKLYNQDKLLLEKTHKGYLESKNVTWAKSVEHLASLIRQLTNH
jgi:glycosyltransferase involved in cell wall biosynthesis